MVRFRSIAALAALSLAAFLQTPASIAEAGDPCCCPPPPIRTTLCVRPPCDCCTRNVTVCVPGCCTEAPTVCWRKGFLGRQVGTYTWACCGHSVEVVVTRRGDVRVRG